MSSTALREVALPAASLRHLRRALRDETDALAAIHALHSAGFESAEEVLRALAATDDGVDEAVFWNTLSVFFQKRGWGQLDHSAPHSGVGLLSSNDWIESENAEEDQPSCAFSAGLLSGILTGAAGDGIAVLETSCRGRGDDACTFAFGSEEAVHQLYGRLVEGSSLEEALRQL